MSKSPAAVRTAFEKRATGGHVSQAQAREALIGLRLPCDAPPIASAIAGADAFSLQDFQALAHKATVYEMFKAMDTNHSDTLCPQEVCAMLVKLGVAPNERSGARRAARIVAAADANNDGELSFEEFEDGFDQTVSSFENVEDLASTWVATHAQREKDASILFDLHAPTGRLSTASAHRVLSGLGLPVDLPGDTPSRAYLQPEHPALKKAEFKALVRDAELFQSFREVDANHSGTITTDELIDLLVDMELVTDRAVCQQQASAMMAAVDADGDGEVTFEEFASAFRQTDAVLEQIVSQWMSMSSVDVGSELSAGTPTGDIPLWQLVLAGGTGGVVSRILTAPLTQAQLVMQTTDVKAQWGQLRAVLRSTLSEGWRSMFRGNLAACLRVFPFSGIVCATYNPLVAMMLDNPLAFGDAGQRAFAGGVAGSLAVIATFPLDTVRARMGVGTSNMTITSTLKTIVKEGGIRNLYSGLFPSLLATVPFIAMQQTFFDLAKGAGLEMGFVPSVGLCLASGSIAGLVAQTIVYPLDILRRNAQVSPQTSGSLGWLRKTIGTHGWGTLFRGYTPTVLRVIPSVMASVVVRDAVLGRV